MTRQNPTVRLLCGLMLCGAMVTTGCSDSSSPTGPTGGPNNPSNPSNPQVVDRTFTFAIGEGGSVSNGSSELRLGFKRVVRDDRCPGDAMCIAGMVYPAVLEFDVVHTQHQSMGSVSLSHPTQISTDGPGSEYKVGVYTVDVEQLAPYRFASLPPIKPEDWRVTVRITSALP